MTPNMRKKYNEYFDSLLNKSEQYINGDIEVDFGSLVVKAIELHMERNLDDDVDRFLFKVVSYALSLHGLKEWFEMNKPIANEIMKSDQFDTKSIIAYFDKKSKEKKDSK